MILFEFTNQLYFSVQLLVASLSNILLNYWAKFVLFYKTYDMPNVLEK